MGFIKASPIYWAPFFKRSHWHCFRRLGKQKRLLLKKWWHRFRGFGKKKWINERIGLKYWIYLIWCFMGYCGLFRRVIIICFMNKFDEIFDGIGFTELGNKIGSMKGLDWLGFLGIWFFITYWNIRILRPFGEK